MSSQRFRFEKRSRICREPLTLSNMLKHGTVRIEGGDFLHDQELQVAQRCFAEIHDVHLHTLQQLAFAYTIERLQVHRSEDDPRYVQTVQVSGQLFRFHPLNKFLLHILF